MDLNGNIDQSDTAAYSDTASRIFQALEYLAMIARKDRLPVTAAHIERALAASLNDYVEDKRAALGAHMLLCVPLGTDD